MYLIRLCWIVTHYGLFVDGLEKLKKLFEKQIFNSFLKSDQRGGRLWLDAGS